MRSASLVVAALAALVVPALLLNGAGLAQDSVAGALATDLGREVRRDLQWVPRLQVVVRSDASG